MKLQVIAFGNGSSILKETKKNLKTLIKDFIIMMHCDKRLISLEKILYTAESQGSK